MKQLILFACLSLFTLGLSAQTVFVDIDAAGAGDGTTWADAYTNLNDALLAAPAGSSVWIAEGTYVTPDSTSFFVDKELTIIGGFNGTEADAADADAAVNVVILSGDVNGDDVSGTFDAATRMDNQPVLFFQDTNAVNAFTISLDGVTIQNGNLGGFMDGDNLLNFAGGGLLSFANCNVSNVTFRDNFADFGSAIVNFGTDGSVYDNITVDGNFPGQGSVVWGQANSNLTFQNSSFSSGSDDVLTTGMLDDAFSTGTTIADCSFDGIASEGRGGAIRANACFDLVIRNTTFNNTFADIGGALYIIDPDGTADADGNITVPEALIEGCTFTDIGSVQWGGVIFSALSSITMKDVTFDDINTLQSGAGRGGIMHAQRFGDPDGLLQQIMSFNNVNINDVTAGGVTGGINVNVEPLDQYSATNVTMTNVSSGSFAGGFGIFGSGPATAAENVATFDNIILDAVSGESFGGGMLLINVDTRITNSSFNNCSTGEGAGNGGGIYVEGADLSTTVENSTFTNNRGLGGSGLAVRSTGADMNTIVTNSTFDSNGSSAAGAHRGGAMYFLHGGGSSVSIDSCTILNNALIADEFVSGGGAVYINNITNEAGDFTFTNSRVEANVLSGTANGGGVYFVDAVDATIDNVDFIANSANDGGALASLLFFVNDTVDNIPLVFLPEFNTQVNNARILNNLAGEQGGAVVTQRSVMSFSNSLFGINAAVANGGGAIIFNGPAPIVENGEFQNAAESILTTNLINNTFYGNAAGTVGDIIALNQAENTFNETEMSMTVTLQNNAFLVLEDDETPIELEDADINGGGDFGDIRFVSLGGNFYNNLNGDMVDAADPMMDIVDTELDDVEAILDVDDEESPTYMTPILTDPESDNPLIDAGTTGDLVAVRGIYGNPRGDFPDIGAVELEWSLTDVQDFDQSGLDMSFFPNPTADVLNIESRDATIQSYRVILTDANGRLLRNNRFNGTVNQIDFTTLPTGVYTLQLEVNGNVYSKQIVKQ